MPVKFFMSQFLIKNTIFAIKKTWKIFTLAFTDLASDFNSQIFPKEEI